MRDDAIAAAEAARVAMIVAEVAVHLESEVTAATTKATPVTVDAVECPPVDDAGGTAAQKRGVLRLLARRSRRKETKAPPSRVSLRKQLLSLLDRVSPPAVRPFATSKRH